MLSNQLNFLSGLAKTQGFSFLIPKTHRKTHGLGFSKYVHNVKGQEKPIKPKNPTEFHTQKPRKTQLPKNPKTHGQPTLILFHCIFLMSLPESFLFLCECTIIVFFLGRYILLLLVKFKFIYLRNNMISISFHIRKTAKSVYWILQYL